jgi:hypothetical protein
MLVPCASTVARCHVEPSWASEIGARLLRGVYIGAYVLVAAVAGLYLLGYGAGLGERRLGTEFT